MLGRFEYTYNIGDRVFYATPDSDEGIVIDISFLIRRNFAMYNVVFGRRNEDDTWCHEEELSTTKIF